MPKDANYPFGRYLKYLREKNKLSLKDVEKATGIANAYISQLETGARRRLPAPDRLRQIAGCYNVSLQEMLVKAGYFESKEIKETFEQRVDKAFLHAINDPRFVSGYRVKPDDVPIEIKKFVVEVYGDTFKKPSIFRNLIVHGTDNVTRRLSWQIKSATRTKITKDRKDYILYKIAVTCTETAEDAEASIKSNMQEVQKKIVETVVGTGEAMQDAETVGTETPIFEKATRAALKDALNKCKDKHWKTMIEDSGWPT